MGVDIPDVRQIVFIGVPCTLESYYQEIDRDGKPARALLYYNGHDIASNKPEMTEEVRIFVVKSFQSSEFIRSAEDMFGTFEVWDVLHADNFFAIIIQICRNKLQLRCNSWWWLLIKCQWCCRRVRKVGVIICT